MNRNKFLYERGTKFLYGRGNTKGDGFFLYLVSRKKRKHNDLYLLKIRSSIKGNNFDLYFKEWEGLEMAGVLINGIVNKRLMSYSKVIKYK